MLLGAVAATAAQIERVLERNGRLVRSVRYMGTWGHSVVENANARVPISPLPELTGGPVRKNFGDKKGAGVPSTSLALSKSTFHLEVSVLSRLGTTFPRESVSVCVRQRGRGVPSCE